MLPHSPLILHSRTFALPRPHTAIKKSTRNEGWYQMAVPFLLEFYLQCIVDRPFFPQKTLPKLFNIPKAKSFLMAKKGGWLSLWITSCWQSEGQLKTSWTGQLTKCSLLALKLSNGRSGGDSPLGGERESPGSSSVWSSVHENDRAASPLSKLGYVFYSVSSCHIYKRSLI